MKEKTSTYTDFLPAIYQRTENDDAAFLSHFLLIFEQILTGLNDNERKGIGEKIDKVFEVFYPFSELMNRPDPSNPNCPSESLSPYFSLTVDEVLHWVADCLAFELEENWSLEKKKIVLLKIISIFRKRGTKKGLEEYLTIYLKEKGFVEIIDYSDQKNISSKQYKYNFKVIVTILTYCLEQIREQINMIKKVIDTEKPVHTNYQLIVTVPIMQIGINSTVGVDTLLGARPMQLGDISTVGVSTLLWGKLKPEDFFDSRVKKWEQTQPEFLPNINSDTWPELPMQIGVRSTINKDTRLSKVPYKDFMLYKGNQLMLCI